MTARQRQIVAYVREFLTEQRRPPSRGEIAQHFGFNRATAQQHIVAIEKLGHLIRCPGARGLTLGPSEALESAQALVPVIGRVAAGTPILAIENRLDEVAIPVDLFRRAPDVVLQVQGDSMKDAGILDNDLIAVVLASTADHGEIVVARIDEEITVKRLHLHRGRIVLKPANPRHVPRFIDEGSDFSIEGVVVGVLRRL
ncbi:MAG: repressor LexA [Proteobacteria bacterium]|nr:repressor LexA [Pseudomonadota bacterium]MBS0598888.1 repressor LexA [Pseudomonadota bacterium]